MMKSKLHIHIAVWACAMLFAQTILGQTCFDGTKNIISTTADGAVNVFAVDIDGDGDNDVLSGSTLDGEVAWYENDGTGNFGSENIISTSGGSALYAIDLDGDGDNDMLSTFITKVFWHENDGAGNFGPENIISNNLTEATDIFAIDIDGDGDNDVIAASDGDGKITWYENDGTGNFGSENIITSGANLVAGTNIYAIDLDGDGDNDIVANLGQEVVWYTNDGSGNFSSENIIDPVASIPEDVYAADLDGDGDNDVLAVLFFDGVFWYENNGTGSFGPENTIATDPAVNILAGDIDGDGDNDVIISGSFGGVFWYENDGSGNFSSQNIVSANVNSPRDIFAIDLDGDGDKDILSASLFDDEIAWYENLCGVSVIPGCTDPCATNYNPNATEDDGSCTLPSANDGCDLTTDSIDPTTCAVVNTPPDVDDGCPNTDDSFDAANCQILNVSNCPTGTELDAATCACVPVAVTGCANPDACNFDATATTDDGSCILPGDTCDDSNPLTDNDTVQADCSCQGEIVGGDAVPTVGEWGLIILALILLNLGVLYIRQTEILIEEA